MLKNGQVRFYHSPNGNCWNSARVERVHRDGTVTVKALWEVKPTPTATVSDYDEVGGFLGYKYRMHHTKLRARPGS